MQLHFDSWDLTPPSVPARSRLYSLQPMGVGTALVESLSGYVIRLAAAHAVRVGDLMKHELSLYIPYFHAAAGILSAINGIGEGARHWVSALERLTFREDLRFLTLLPFAAILRTPRLMRQERAWCPRCYEEQAEHGQGVYEQLVWCLQCVEVCPLHKKPLETSCHACHRKLRPVCGISRPGYCYRCRRWLGFRCASSRSMPVTDYQVWVAQELGQLVAISPHFQSNAKQNIQQILTRWVDLCSEGKRAVGAEAIRCDPASFSNWCKGATVPRIDLLLRLCYALKIRLISLILGNEVESEVIANGKAAVMRRCHVAPQRTAAQISAALVLAANEQPPPSIREVAQRLGYSTPTRLYVAESDLCKTIVRNFNKSGRDHHWWRRRGAKHVDDSVIRKTLEQSVSVATPPPLHRVALSLGYGTSDPLEARFPDLCRTIIVKRAKVAVARRNALVSTLKSALVEDKPPALEEVARRAGYNSDTSIRDLEPDLCAQLTARRRECREASRKALNQRLKAMLTEDPPPSWHEVQARLGITRAVSYGNFRDIHCAILARYWEFRGRSRPGPYGFGGTLKRQPLRK